MSPFRIRHHVDTNFFHDDRYYDLPKYWYEWLIGSNVDSSDNNVETTAVMSPAGGWWQRLKEQNFVVVGIKSQNNTRLNNNRSFSIATFYFCWSNKLKFSRLPPRFVQKFDLFFVPHYWRDKAETGKTSGTHTGAQVIKRLQIPGFC